MDFLAGKIMAHFHEKGGRSTLEMKRDIESFLRANGGVHKSKIGENIDPVLLRQTYKYCERLKNEGALLDFGNQRNVPILGNKYINLEFNVNLGEYGGYDFLVQGFQLIQKTFSGSVLKIVVQDKIGDYSIGTCFVVKDNLIVTAKHCIENFKRVFINDPLGNPIIPEKISISNDPNIDIAIIQTKGNPFNIVKQFMFGEPEVLEEILTMGYPPLATFDAIQINDTAHINSIQKSSKGKIVAQELRYGESTDYIILNAKVKGGNSGGPVINKFGTVVGIIVNVLPDIDQPEKLDQLGYGIAISANEIIEIIENDFKNNDGCIQIPFEVLNDGFSTLL